MSRVLSFVWISVLSAFALQAQVKINEVLFHQDSASADAYRAHQWIELYNAGADPVDLTGWSVAGRRHPASGHGPRNFAKILI